MCRGPGIWISSGFDLNVGGTYRGHPESYFGPFDLPNLKGGCADEYLTDRLTVEAETFLEANSLDANHDRPFFLYLPEFAVHLPLQAKPGASEHFQGKAPPNAPQHNPVYAAMIASLDENVGRVLKKLDDLELTERTVVFFMSDNGGLVYEGKGKETITSNAPLRAGKGHLYEGGIREPMMIRWPGVTKPGSTCNDPVISIDFFPTILEMAGVKVDPKSAADGLSLTQLLKGNALKPAALYRHYPHYSNQGGVPSAAIRSGKYKLIEFYEHGRLELYNLAEDIRESNNLLDANPKLASELRGKLKQWRAAVAASMPVPNPNYDSTTADQGLTGVNPQPAR